MKKTAFDKIVVGFVVLVVIIFALLMVYSISTCLLYTSPSPRDA